MFDFEIDEREREEPEQMFDFEIDDESKYRESGQYDPLVEKFSERLYEIASRFPTKSYEVDTGIEREIDEFVKDLEKEVFEYGLGKWWKKAKKLHKRLKRLPGYNIIKNAAINGIPALRALNIASQAIRAASNGGMAGLIRGGLGAAASGLIPGGAAGMNIIKGLGIIPGAGAAANKDGLKNIVQVASDNYKQLANQVMTNSAAADPVEAPKIAASELEVAINKNKNAGYRPVRARSTYQKRTSIKRTKKIYIPAGTEYVRVSFYRKR
jgi:hypothetical protein